MRVKLSFYHKDLELIRKMAKEVLVQIREQDCDKIQICVEDNIYYCTQVGVNDWEYVNKNKDVFSLDDEAVAQLIATEMFYFGQRNVSVFLFKGE